MLTRSLPQCVHPRRASHGSWPAALVGGAALIVYARTLAPSIVWGDSPELTTAAYCGGVAHPTGYPLYTMAGYLFTRLWAWGSVAYRMNLLSAFFAVAAVTLSYLLALRLTRSRSLSAVTALLFAFSETFWSQAVIAEVYALHVLFVAAVLLCLLVWDASGQRRWLQLSALVYGLSFTHHLMTVLLAPGLLYFVLSSRLRPQFVRDLPRLAILFLAPILLYLYIPLAALRDPPLNWGDPRTWDNFLAHVTGRQYERLMFHSSLSGLWTRVAAYGGSLVGQFSIPLLVLAVLGAFSLARHERRVFGVTLLTYLVSAAYAVNYDIPDIHVYYLPSYLVVALWIGCGLRQVVLWLTLLWRRLGMKPGSRSTFRGVLLGTLFTIPIVLLAGNWQSINRHNDWGALTYGRAALQFLKQDAVVLGDTDHWFFPLLYTRFVEGRRSDVILLGLPELTYPERVRLVTRLRSTGLEVRVPQEYVPHGRRDRLAKVLLERLLADNVGKRPVYLLGVTTLPTLERWIIDAVQPYYRTTVSNLPLTELTREPPHLQPLGRPGPLVEHRVTFASPDSVGKAIPQVQLIGYDAERMEGDVPWVRLRYYWRVLDPRGAARARVRVLLTYPEGIQPKVQHGGASELLHNHHKLGQAGGPTTIHLTGRLCETFDLYVPPAGWQVPLDLLIAVQVDDTFLSPGGAGPPFTRLGPLPAVPQPPLPVP